MGKYQVQTEDGTFEVETEEAAPAASPFSLQGVKDFLSKQKFSLLPSAQQSQINLETAKRVEPALKNAGIYQGPEESVEAARPFSIPAAMSVAGSAASMTPGGPIPKALVGATAGAGTYLGLDSLLQNLSHSLSGSSELSSTTDSLKQLAVNELGTRAVGATLKKLTPSQEQLSKLGATFSQYFEGSKIPKALEDLFAPGAKAKAILNSGKLANEAIGNEASNLAGIAKSTTASPERLAQRIQVNDFSNALDSTFKEADKQAVTAKLIAKGNPHSFRVGTTPPRLADEVGMNGISQNFLKKDFSQLNPQEQQQIIQLAPRFGVNPQIIPGAPILNSVDGPVHMGGTLEQANKIIQDTKDLTLGVPEEQKKLVNQAYKLVNATNAKFDPASGKLLTANPIGFEEAWNQKQAFDDAGGWNKNRNDLTQSDRAFRQFSRSLNDDIDNSIPQWKNDPNKLASKAWLNAKATVAQRNQLFFPEGSSNKLGDIIQEADSTLPAIDKILSDPNQLQRTLNAGEIKFPSGTVSSTNTKKDLQAYNLIRMRDAAKTLDPKNPATLTLDAKQLQNTWNDPRFVEQKKMLYSAAQRADYDQLFKNIAFTQEKQNAIGSYISKLWLVRSGLAIAPSLLTGYLSGSAERGLEVAGVELGAMGVAKLMANPETARMMVAAAAGQPLGISEQMAARRIATAIQGVGITLTSKDGKQEKGSIQDGRFVADPQ